MPNLILKEVVLNINVICNCVRCNCLQTELCFSVIIQNSVPSPFNSLQRSTLASHWPLLFLAPFLRPKCVEDFPFHFVYPEKSNFIIVEALEGLSLSYPTGHVIHRPEKLKEDIQFPLCASVSMLQVKCNTLCMTFYSSVFVICMCTVRGAFRMLLK